jgi:prepilin-type N-terminal cleavage/methylation domain-containing protein
MIIGSSRVADRQTGFTLIEMIIVIVILVDD